MTNSLNNGLILGYQAGQDDQEQVTAIWRRQANEMQGHLNQQVSQNADNWLKSKAWLEVAKLMMEEIRESNPNSPLADRDYVNGLFQGMCTDMRGQLQSGVDPDSVKVAPR
jgi:hypothetical protein